MEYRSTTNKRLNRSNSSSNSKNVNKSRNSPNKVFSSIKKNSSKLMSYDLVKFFNASTERRSPYQSSASSYSSTTVPDHKIDVHFAKSKSFSSEVSNDRCNNKLIVDAITTSNSESAINSRSETYNYINNADLSSSSSSQFVKNNGKHNKDRYSYSQEIFTKSNSFNKNQNKKRRSTLNEGDFSSDEPAAKRMQMMDSLSSLNSFAPIASTSSFSMPGVSYTQTPSSYQNSEVHSLSSSIGSSPFNSPPSPVGATEIDDYIDHEVDARSSSSCLSTGVELDFGPSSDESTLIESSTTYPREYENSKEGIVKVNQYYVTPHKCRALTPSLDMRPCPLPALSWANASDVWNAMCKTDERTASERTSSMMENHCGLQSRMRAILLDWLIEVCEVYKLHRETYYLAVDYLDRYLSTQKNIQKTHLQLIGITCLFVAAKVEEIYPPKIGEFAYVTDGACQEEDILQHELLLLSALDWKITPVTIVGWLGIYMQLNTTNRSASNFLRSDLHGIMKDPSILSSKVLNKNNCNYLKKCQDKNILCVKENNNLSCNNNDYFNIAKQTAHGNGNNSTNAQSSNSSSLFGNDSGISISSAEIDDAFIYPQFSGYEFSQTAQLIDLCTLDLEIANFPYSVIAAAAISHTFSKETAIRVSGYDWESLIKCVTWMQPFFDIIKDEAQFFFLTEQNEQIQTKQGLGHFCPKIVTDESHMVQTHTTSITMLEKAFLRKEQLSNAVNQPEASPAVKTSRNLCPEGLLTPPASSRKPIDNDEGESSVQRIH